MVFNTAAVYLDNRVHLMYRAMGEDNVSRIGYASSSDGYVIDERLPNPIFEPKLPDEMDGCEDPRLTLFKDRIIMTYTALRRMHPQLDFQVAISSISVDDLLSKRWNWGERKLPFPGIRNKNAVLFPRKIKKRYVMYHRIEPDICVSYSDDFKHWCDMKAVMKPRMRTWDCLKVGVAGPPMELSEGWLLIYHGVDYDMRYCIGSALIDKSDPENILYRSEKPILEPEKNYERFGKVPNVVFSCGSILKENQIIIYYGGADTVICAVTYDLSEIIP
jgi:predicted GH43/DUF377 family glycosyl hydrolase